MYRSAMVVTVAFGLLFASAASSAAPRSELRELRQEVRIAQGVRSGALTAPEAARLIRGQRRVDAAQQRARADGVVTRRERAMLAYQQNRQSVRIVRQTHDAQRRIR